MAENIQEKHIIVPCFPSAKIAANEDIFNGSPASAYINMKNWGRATFCVLKNAGASGTARATVKSADDTSGTGATNRAHQYRYAESATDVFSSWTAGVASGTVISAGADEVWQFSLSARDLGGQEYVGITLTEVVDSAVDGAAFCLLTDPCEAKSIADTTLT